MKAFKDYYGILKVPKTATTDEIKKAFRKSALYYHLDKNKDSPFAADKYLEIQEAYLILKDRQKRNQYHTEWLSNNLDSHPRISAETPEEILQAATGFHQFVRSTDPFRINLDLITIKYHQVLSVHNLEVLYQINDHNINHKITDLLLEALYPIPLTDLIDKLELLKKIGRNDIQIEQKINDFLFQKKWRHHWERYQLLFAFLIAVLFCLFLFWSVK